MFAISALTALLSVASAAEPAAAPADAPRVGVDIEVDPLAYAVGGASIHGGLHVEHFRFDLGVFSLTLPEGLHGNPGFIAQGHGFGLKADWFPRQGNTGLHIGAQVDITNQIITEADSGASELYRELATGGRVGYRVQHRSGFYVNPWVGLLYRTNSPTEIELAGETFTQSRLVPFPTVHIGWAAVMPLLLLNPISTSPSPSPLDTQEPTMQTRTLPRPEGQLTYDIHGDGGGVPLVCVPGLGDTRASFRALAPALAAAGHTVYVLDLRGHGDSDATFSSHSAADIGDDVAALLEAEDLTGAVVVGNSIGGGAACRVAVVSPERVSGLVLLNPFVRDMPVERWMRPLVPLLFARPWGTWAWGQYRTTLFKTAPDDQAANQAEVLDNLRQPARLAAVRAMLRASKGGHRRAPVRALGALAGGDGRGGSRLRRPSGGGGGAEGPARRTGGGGDAGADRSLSADRAPGRDRRAGPGVPGAGGCPWGVGGGRR